MNTTEGNTALPTKPTMSNQAIPAYAVIQGVFSLFGVGLTKEEAVERTYELTDEPVEIVPEHGSFSGDLICVPCTQALYDEMSDHEADGTVGWTLLNGPCGRYVCTAAEAIESGRFLP